jgi:hypothetical protein
MRRRNFREAPADNSYMKHKVGPVVAVVLMAVAYALIAWRSSGRASTRQAGRAPAPAPAATVANAKPDPAAAVQALVDAHNRALPHEADTFRADGWKIVSAPPPDGRLLRYDPELLLEGREQELRVQLASTVATPGDAARIASIVRRAHDVQTRVTAVEALGRIATGEAQGALCELLGADGPAVDDPARSLVVPLLRPAGLDDPLAGKLASLMDSPSVTAVERKQLAFTLALTGLRDGMTLPAATLAALSPASLRQLDEMIALARAGSAPLAHNATEGGR